MPRRSCWCPRWRPSVSRRSPRCWPIPHHRPGQVLGWTAAPVPSTFGAQQATCPQGHTSSSWEPRRPASHRHDCDHFREGHLRALPGPRAVHHLGVPGAVSSPCTPSRSTKPSSPPGHPEHEGLPGQIRTARWCRRHYPPGRGRHRHAARPLPRTGQDPPGTHQRCGRAQPDPVTRLVERASAGPDPHQPPRPPRTRPGLMNTRNQQGRTGPMRSSVATSFRVESGWAHSASANFSRGGCDLTSPPVHTPGSTARHSS